MDTYLKLEKQRKELDSKFAQLKAKTVDGVQIEAGKTYLWDSMSNNFEKKFLTIPEYATFTDSYVEWDENYGRQPTKVYYGAIYSSAQAYVDVQIRQLGYVVNNSRVNMENAQKRIDRLTELKDNIPTEDFNL